MALRVRMLGGTQVGYARMTRRWWLPVQNQLSEQGLADAPTYFVSSNTHSLVNIVTGTAREREERLIEFVETLPEDDILREELAAFREGRAEGSWDNFLYFVARLYFDIARRGGPPRAGAVRGAQRRLAPARRAPRCACPRRSSRSPSCCPTGSTRGSAKWTPRRCRAATP